MRKRKYFTLEEFLAARRRDTAKYREKNLEKVRQRNRDFMRRIRKELKEKKEV